MIHRTLWMLLFPVCVCIVCFHKWKISRKMSFFPLKPVYCWYYHHVQHSSFWKTHYIHWGWKGSSGNYTNPLYNNMACDDPLSVCWLDWTDLKSFLQMCIVYLDFSPHYTTHTQHFSFSPQTLLCFSFPVFTEKPV